MASVFSDAEIQAFLDFIGLPPTLKQKRYTGNPEEDLRFLRQLTIHTISTIPYENLTLHYSPSHTISITPRDSYKKIILDGRGRGGYCMENSLLYNHILRGLSFPVYTAAVRVRPRVDGVPTGDYSGWVHLVNIVTLSNGSKWAMDVGFGGDGATAPLPLVDCSKNQATYINLGSQENRLIRDWIPTQALRTEDSKLWTYQYRNSPDKAWNSFFAFADVEALEADFGIMNWYTGSNPTSFQTFTQLVVKFLGREKNDGSGDMEIYGKRMLVNHIVKENLGGKTAIVAECKTEQERIEALEKWFDIKLTLEEQQSIKGWSTELGGDGSRIRKGAQSFILEA